MLTPQEAEELVGHAVGGVCPFAVNGVAGYVQELGSSGEGFIPAFDLTGL